MNTCSVGEEVWNLDHVSRISPYVNNQWVVWFVSGEKVILPPVKGQILYDAMNEFTQDSERQYRRKRGRLDDYDYQTGVDAYRAIDDFPF